MIVQVGDGYLELNEPIQVEKKVKLFDDVSATEGDFSYEFSIPKSQNNVELIRVFKQSQQDKIWNRKIPSNILDDSGVVIYSGFIRIEDDSNDEFSYQASFFSGNTNWIELLGFNLLDLNWSKFDVEYADILDFDKTSGLVFPLTDRGILYERANEHFMLDDFQGYMYAKSIVNVILANNAIKLTGGILKDPIYNKLITSAGTNKFLSTEIENRTAYIGKSSNQTITTSYATATFTNVSDPFSNSPMGNWSVATSRYIFDLDVRDYDITVKLNYAVGSPYYSTGVRIVKNGITTLYTKAYKTRVINATYTVNELDDTPSTGDYYQIQLAVQTFSTNRTLLAGSSITIKPTKFYKVFAGTVIPDMNANDFLSNIFRMLNCIVTYNNITQTLTADILDTALNRQPTDISEYVSRLQNNYSDFVNDYAQSNLLIWGDQSNDLVDQYNEDNLLPYGSGELTIDNDFLEAQSNFLEMDFVAPFQRSYPNLGIELPLTDFIEVSVLETRNITSVTVDSSSGADLAVFDYSGSSLGNVLVRIIDSTISDYNADYWAISSGSTFNGYVDYQGDATATMQVLRVTLKSSDPVFLLNNPSQNIGSVSGFAEFFVENLVPRTNIAVANFLNTTNYKTSLGFDYLKNLYFRNTEKLLNSGIMCLCDVNLPYKVYRDIDFLRPLRIDGIDFYPNKLTGYISSSEQAQIELIKK
jgi:hypothetical protein